MKYCIMQHFIWVYTDCLRQNLLSKKDRKAFGNYNLKTLDIYTLDHLKFIVSNKKEEQNVRPDLDPTCLTVMVFLKEFFKKIELEKKLSDD